MQGFKFTPNDRDTEIKVPYMEDARADFAPYWSAINDVPTEKKIADAQREISQELAKLGGMPIRFTEGVFEREGIRRYGFEITFVYGGMQGVLRVAGLPIRSETLRLRLGCQIQALKIVRDWLKAAVTAKVFSPGNDPLLGNVLLPDGSGRTVADYIREQGDLPRLAAPATQIIVE